MKEQKQKLREIRVTFVFFILYTKTFFLLIYYTIIILYVKIFVNLSKKGEKMKTKFLSSFMAIACLICCGFCFSSCGVVAAAWVNLKTDTGYVVYTSDMYGTVSGHICYYNSQEEASDPANAVMKITFLPRILGPDVEVGNVTVVDISQKLQEMDVVFKKVGGIYSESKHFYLTVNNETRMLNVDSKYESETIVSLVIKDPGFAQGNPNGQLNGIINYIEYK